jgi:hypothetical protein
VHDIAPATKIAFTAAATAHCSHPITSFDTHNPLTDRYYITAELMPKYETNIPCMAVKMQIRSTNTGSPDPDHHTIRLRYRNRQILNFKLTLSYKNCCLHC